MSNPTHPNTSSTRPGVVTRIKGVFGTVHGIGENIRGRTLGAIDNMSKSGTPESTSRFTSMADRGRMEAETGMAHMYGYPDPNAENMSHNEPGRVPQPTTTGTSGHTTGTGPETGLAEHDQYGRGDAGRDVGGKASGYGADGPDPNTGNMSHNEPGRTPQPTTTGTSGHTTGTGPGTGLAEHHYYGRGDAGKGVGRGASGYGVDDGSGGPGAQNLEQQQPTIDRGDRNMEMGPSTDPRGGGLSPNRGPPQRAGSEGGRSPTSQAGTLTPGKQMVGKDSPPEIPPRPQAQATDNNQSGQMYQ